MYLKQRYKFEKDRYKNVAARGRKFTFITLGALWRTDLKIFLLVYSVLCLDWAPKAARQILKRLVQKCGRARAKIYIFNIGRPLANSFMNISLSILGAML